jgi:outer membrane protein OmpA-like peptidoglycan-associated protein
MVRQKALSKKQPAWFGLLAQKSAGGYPMPKAEGPQKPPETAPIKFDAPGDGLFDFDDANLLPSANQYIDKFVNQVKKVYTTYGGDVFSNFMNFLNSQNLQVKGYASADGDPNQVITGKSGCPKSKRQDYDLCLSQKRAQAVAKAITDKITGLKLTAKGMGYGTFVPNWTKEDPKTHAETADNRRFVFDIPPFNTTVKKN